WKQPRLRRAHARTIARLFGVAALVASSSVLCIDNQRVAVAREFRKFFDCLEDTILDFAVTVEIAIGLIVLDVPFAALRVQSSVALALSRRKRKRCIVAVPDAFDSLALFVEIGEQNNALPLTQVKLLSRCTRVMNRALRFV